MPFASISPILIEITIQKFKIHKKVLLHPNNEDHNQIMGWQGWYSIHMITQPQFPAEHSTYMSINMQ